MKLPKLLSVGTRIMCDCDDEQCYKAVEVTFDGLVLYEDVSDAHADFLIIQLPEGVDLVRYEEKA